MRFKDEDVAANTAAAALRFLGSGKLGDGAILRVDLGDFVYGQ